MFQQKTTIIVGAGASCELNLPSGDELKELISAALQPTSENMFGFKDPQFVQAVMRRVDRDGLIDREKLRAINAAAERVLAGLRWAMSIDNFLHSHRGDQALEELAKMAIAHCILKAERSSHLFPPLSPAAAWMRAMDDSPHEEPIPSIVGAELSETWYAPFARFLLQQAHKDAPEQAFSNVRFVIFNYDRCLEHFLWLALQDYFAIDGERAGQILQLVEFIHPYGSLGALPWQVSEDARSVPLGAAARLDLHEIGSGLRTFTESVHSEIHEKVTRAVATAETLIFLGFGYLDQNIRLMIPPGVKTASRLLSTAYGIKEEDQEVIKATLRQFSGTMQPRIIIEPATCRALFDHHRLELSLR